MAPSQWITSRRSLFVALSAALLATPTTPSTSNAQALVRRITGGAVSGLEMSIEGPTSAPRGGHVQWQLGVYEVTGLSTLRVAPGTRVRVLSSFMRERAMAEVTADAFGRAQLGFDVPADAPASFHVVFEAISRNNIRRQFDLDISVTAGRQLTLFTDRRQVKPGGRVNTWGRLVSTATGRPIADAPVVVTLFDARNRPVQARQELRTDARGMIAQGFTLPSSSFDTFSIRAQHTSEHDSSTATQNVQTLFESAPPLIVRASPEQSIVEPRQLVRMMVSVRTADGRPVADAVVRSPRIPRIPRQTEEPSVRTDARGLVTFQFVAPELASGSVPMDLPVSVSASRVGIGDASTNASVRIARAGLFGAASIEGGSIIEGLPGRIYARIVRSDGSPAGAGVAVSLTGPRFGRGARATTDASGVAVLDVTLGAAPAARPRPAARPAADADGEAPETEDDSPQDPCGGTTATSFAMSIEEGAVRGNLNSCAPIEPDGTLRVRVREGALVQPGAEVHVTLSRTASVARTPVHVTLLSSNRSTHVPLVSVVAAAGANEVTLRVPEHARGLLLVRARPLFGPLFTPVVGGSTALWSHLGQRSSLAISSANGQQLVVDSGAASDLAATVSVVPRAGADFVLEQLRGNDATRNLGDLRMDFARASDALVAGSVASFVSRDVGAPALVRAGRIVALPAPEDPAAWGTLRDPYRSSARFVEGRLALVFQRIENHIAAMVRTRRADVGQRAGARWEFNREIFDAILRSSSEDTTGGARNLGGAPMTIDDLRRLDASFTFDNVARRITRKRMFTLLVALRQFVNQHALDLRWSWRGDPTVWLRQIGSSGEFEVEDSEGNSSTISADDMVDGWGNRFELRPAPGGRSRFPFLAPVPGFELVSAGPDERIGTADDVRDPFARILPSGGAFARAVDEDGLIARLRGVELGRATIARLGGVFEEGFEAEYSDSGEDSDGGSGGDGPNWYALPSRVPDNAFALALVRPAHEAESILRPSVALSGATTVETRVDDEPRTWTAIVHAFGADGSSTYATRMFVAGTPVLVSLPLSPRTDELRPPVPRLRVGEPIEVVATVTNVDGNDHRYSVAVSAEGPVRVTATSALDVPAGRSAEVPITIEATGAGRGAVRIQVIDASGAVLRSTRAPVVSDFGGLALREDVMNMARGEALNLRGAIPSGARGVSARLLVSTATGLADDPELDRVRRTDPALIAWSYALAGRTVPAALRDAVFAAQQPSGEVTGDAIGRSVNASSLLSTAAALVLWAGSDEEDTQSQTALALSRARFSSLGASIVDSDPIAGRVRAQAATLAALATGAPSASGNEGTDPVIAFVESTRDSLRSIHTTHAAQPTLLARAAAALLLTDPADTRGRQMYERARQFVVDEGARGALVGAGEGRVRLEEVLAATAAMALAAQQRGDLALTQKLARGVAVRAHLAMRAGGEVAFWLLADAAFGVFGLDAPTRIRAVVNGETRELSLEDGRASWGLGAAPEATIALEALGAERNSAALIARWEAVYDRPSAPRTDGPVSLAIQGDVGYSGERSALELTITGTSETAAQRVAVEIQLPAGSVLDGATVSQLRSSFAGVELRDGGLLRVVLPAIAKEQVVTVPLALRWMLRGSVSGLGVVAYAEDRPTRLSVLPPRAISLQARPARSAQGAQGAAVPATSPAASGR